MGSSGCGKTTTLRMLAGLEAPSEGEIRLDGKRINDLPTWERDTPLVWQSLALFPFLTVLENVEFGLRMRGVGQGRAAASAPTNGSSACRSPSSPTATSRSSRAASGNASRWRARW